MNLWNKNSYVEHDTVSARIMGGYGISPERTKSDNKLALLEEEILEDERA